MAATHPCPGCGDVAVPRHQLSCPGCWYRLPRELRNTVNATYRRDAGAHIEAVAEAIAWYETHPPGRRGLRADVAIVDELPR